MVILCRYGVLEPFLSLFYRIVIMNFEKKKKRTGTIILCPDKYYYSTAECERSFSQMKDIFTPIRYPLSIETVSDLIFIHNIGPPLIEWHP